MSHPTPPLPSLPPALAARLARLLARVEVPGTGPARVDGQPVPDLEAALYGGFYCRDAAPAAAPAPGEAAEVFQRSLAAAAGGNGPRFVQQAGWLVQAVGAAGQVLVARHGRELVLSPGQYVFPDGGFARPGERAEAYFVRWSATLQPGFFFVFSRVPPVREETFRVVRLYWHVAPERAAELTAWLPARLDRFAVPYRFKVLADPALYGRADAAVLYVARRDFALAAELAAEGLAARPELLEATTPLFTKPLAPGLAVAEDPAGRESFGTHRCRLLAAGLRAAAQAGATGAEERLRHVAASFAQAGLSLATPWLERPAAGDPYTLPEEAA